MSQDRAEELVEQLRAKAMELYQDPAAPAGPPPGPTVIVVPSGDYETDMELVRCLKLADQRQVVLMSRDMMEKLALQDQVLAREDLQVVMMGTKTASADGLSRDVGRGLTQSRFWHAPLDQLWAAPKLPNNQPHYRQFAHGRSRKTKRY